MRAVCPSLRSSSALGEEKRTVPSKMAIWLQVSRASRRTRAPRRMVMTIRRGARVRLEARETWSQIAILEGTVRFSSPSAELDLKEGQTALIEPQHANRFYLYNEIAPLDTDRWNEERDKILAAASSGAQVPGLQYGLSDLDTGGSWIQIPELGLVWRPTVTEGWAPFRNGKWLWYDA